MIIVAGLALCACILALQLKTIKSEYGMLITLAACFIIFFYIINKLSVIIDMVKDIMSTTSVNSSYITILIKIVGITYIAEFCADICKDCGYSAMSNQVQIFGKLTVLSLSVPIIESLINLIGEII